MKAFSIEEYQQLHLNDDRLKKCYDEKWFKLFVPNSYGGLELSMEKGCRELLKVAEIQGGLGWAVNLGAGANWFSGFFNDEVAKDLFSPEKAVIAGSGFAGGEWRETQRGYEITGQWSKCTGANHATLFSLIANNTEQGSKIFVVPRKEVLLSADKWPIMGMRNTSSFGISLNKAKVPRDYSFQMNVIKNNPEYGVLHIPFQSFARLCMSATYLGVIQCLVNYCIRDLKKTIALEIIEKELIPLIQASKQMLFETANQVEVLSLKVNYSEDTTLQLCKLLGENNMKIFNFVQSLFLAGGLSFIEEDKYVHWAYRDVLTAAQHFLVKP